MVPKSGDEQLRLVVYPIIDDGFYTSHPQRYNMEKVETESPNERNWAMKNKKPPYFSIKYILVV